MKVVKTEEAVGLILCQDITQIIKDIKKDVVFRKGHIITKEDIPVLLSVGKDNVYVWEDDPNLLHENDAAKILVTLCKSDYMNETNVKEGKIELIADIDGLLKVDGKALQLVNSFGNMMIASRHGNTKIRKNDKICGTRVIPLAIEKDVMNDVSYKCRKLTNDRTIFTIKPFKHKKIGIITTGNEVYYKRIEDTFTPVIIDKFSEYDCEIKEHVILDDNDKKITNTIIDMIHSDIDVVVCTGGMSVDPDDKTPLAIKNTNANIVSYGSPVLPGAMFLLAYYKKSDGKMVTIMGLPGCVMYAKRTIFDLVLPRVMADDEIDYDELSSLGEGGLCLNCDVCTFPNCGFGKGW